MGGVGGGAAGARRARNGLFQVGTGSANFKPVRPIIGSNEVNLLNITYFLLPKRKKQVLNIFSNHFMHAFMGAGKFNHFGCQYTNSAHI